MQHDLTIGKIQTHLIKIAIPSMVGYFFHTLFNITDTIFAGYISTSALAGLSLSSSIFFMILAIGIGMSEALTSIVGNAFGKSDLEYARNIVLNALLFAFVLAIFLSLSGLFFTPYLIDILGDSSYKQETLDYINFILMGALFFLTSFFLNALLNALGDTKSFRNVLVFTALLNVFFNYIFVFWFELGIQGIALATILCEFIVTAYLFYKLRQTSLWSGVKTFKYNKNIIGNIIKEGIPPSVNLFMMALGMYIITYFVAPFGKEAVAGFGIGMRIEQMFLMPIVGLSVASLSIISQNNGAKAYHRIDPTLTLSVYYGWVISTIGVITYWLFGDVLASFLTSDAFVIHQASTYLKISGFASYGFVVVFIYISMFQGISKPNIIMPLSIYRQILAPILMFIVFGYFHFSIEVYWIGIDIIVLSSALFLYGYKKRAVKL